MAFKMNRPLKMKGPMKSVLKLGRTNKTSGSSGVYYNSKMGPMQMHSPSALKQMEEDMEGMEEMMSMMGETGGGAPPAEDGAPVEETETKEQPQTGTMPGQDIISEDGEFYLDEGQDQIYIEDPDGIVAKHVDEDGYVEDVDFIYELTDENYYKVTGVADVSEGGEFEEGVPGYHANPQE